MINFNRTTAGKAIRRIATGVKKGSKHVLLFAISYNLAVKSATLVKGIALKVMSRSRVPRFLEEFKQEDSAKKHLVLMKRNNVKRMYVIYK